MGFSFPQNIKLAIEWDELIAQSLLNNLINRYASDSRTRIKSFVSQRICIPDHIIRSASITSTFEVASVPSYMSLAKGERNLKKSQHFLIGYLVYTFSNHRLTEYAFRSKFGCMAQELILWPVPAFTNFSYMTGQYAEDLHLII